MVKKKEKKKGRNPCCEKNGVRRGAWTVAEDKILVDFITENGHGSWRHLPKLAGLLRCGKSCRLRWTNYLRPDIKRGPFTAAEQNTIIRLQTTLGNKWAAIASHMPGRTDNDIKNFWNSHLRKRLLNEPPSSSKSPDMNDESPLTPYKPQWESVQLKASSRLPDEPLLLKTPSASDPGGDFFLRLWNSEVGQSFQNINENTSDSEIAASHSPPFQTLSLTKVESGLGAKKVVEPCKITVSPETSEQNLELSKPKEEAEDVAANSDLSRSNEMDESSDAMLELLLDFPVGDDDMGFLQDLLYDVSTYIQK